MHKRLCKQKNDIDEYDRKKGVSRLTDTERPAELDPAKLNDLVLVCGSGKCVDAGFFCTLLFGFFTYGFFLEYRDQHSPE